jgi:NAD(P) transhydrogenase
MQLKYDLIVIGSGPAGTNAAITMSKHGKKVLIIENRNYIGGGCLHTGTIPSKTMREAALVLGSSHKEAFGHVEELKNESTHQIAYTSLIVKLRNVITTEIDVLRQQLSRNQVDVVIGNAEFINSTCLKVIDANGDTSKYQTEFVLIATGSSPNRPKEVPFDDHVICDSDSILEMGANLPKSMIIVGAGVIGSEYACIFSRLGVKVHLINKYKEVLNFIDKDVRSMLMEQMKRNGIMLHTEMDIESISITKEKKARVVLSSGIELEAGKLLYTQGRNGNTKKLNLAAAGINIEKYDLIKVNEFFQTSVPNIFACGDVIGYPSLASVSGEQGRFAANHMAGKNVNAMSDLFPYGIYTIPEISFVGKTEEQLIAANIPYVTGTAHYKEVSRGLIKGENRGLLKMHIHQENLTLLGVHIIGYGASELVHIGQAVMAFNGGLDYFLDHVFNYPTWAEAYKVAALSASNNLLELQKKA